jgi:transcriptional regulator with XRE-family HTH domain
MLTLNKPRYTRQRFAKALKALMQESRLSYRQLAYKTRLSAGYLNHLTQGTRPVPADAVINNVAAALHVQPDFFLEFRLRQVVDVLDKAAPLVAGTHSSVHFLGWTMNSARFSDRDRHSAQRARMLLDVPTALREALARSRRDLLRAAVALPRALMRRR